MHYLTMTEVGTFSLFLNLERLKKIQACTGFESLTSAIPVQRATNWTNKQTGSRSLSWFVIKTWKDNDEAMNVWKSYMRTAGWIIMWKRIIAVIDATFAVGKRNLKKKIFDLLSYNSYFTMYYYHYVAVVERFNYVCWNKHPLMPCNCWGKAKG